MDGIHFKKAGISGNSRENSDQTQIQPSSLAQKKYSMHVSRNNGSDFPAFTQHSIRSKKQSSDGHTIGSMQKNKPFLTYGNLFFSIICVLDLFKSLGQAPLFPHNNSSPSGRNNQETNNTTDKFYQSHQQQHYTNSYKNSDTNNGAMNYSLLSGSADPYQQSFYRSIVKSHQQENKMDITEKLKINMGFLSFKKAKDLSPIKFQYRKSEKQEQTSGNSKYFKQNPQLLEFMRVGPLLKQNEDEDSKKQKRSMTANVLNRNRKKIKEKSLLKCDKRALGSKSQNNFNDLVFDRFNDPQQHQKPGSPPIGSYFKYNTPVRIARGGQQLVYMRESQV